MLWSYKHKFHNSWKSSIYFTASKLDSMAIGGNGVIELTSVPEHGAQAVISIRVIGLGLERAVKRGQGFIELAPVPERIA